MTRRASLISGAFVLAAVLAGCGGESSTLSSSNTVNTGDAPDTAVTDTTAAVLCPVLSASADIPAGTTAAKAVTEGMVTEAVMPAEFVPTSAVRGLEQLSGSAVFDIAANSVLVDGMFAPSDPSTSPSLSPPPECEPPSSPEVNPPGETNPPLTVPPDDADSVVTAPLTSDPTTA